MSAKIVEVGIVRSSPSEAKTIARADVLWNCLTIIGFGGAGLTFVAGLLVSLLAATEIVPVSQKTSLLTTVLLLSSFCLAFLGAHSMDKRRSRMTDDRSDQNYG